MNTTSSKHILLAVAAGSLLPLALSLLLNGAPPAAHADPSDLFVSPTGTGSSCSQSDPCGLQTALTEAWIGDTVFVAGGTYTGDGDAVITLTLSIDLLGGWDGTPSGPVVRDPEIYRTVLDGENQRRAVYIQGGITPVLDGFVVINGNASHGLEPGNGGGIYSTASSPIITNNVISNNIAYSGTGADWGWGGGIFLASASELTLIAGNTIVSNTASSSHSGKGGGLAVLSGAPVIDGNTFQGNVAGLMANSQGGGIYLERSPATINQNTILGNKGTPTGSGFGGGFHTQFGKLTIDGNMVISNVSSYGALTFDGNERMTMTNNLVAHNVGGVFVDGGAVFPLAGTLAHNTIAQNGGAGISVGWYNWNHSTLTLTNNIIISHTTGIFVREAPTNRVSATHTLFYGNDTDTAGPIVSSTDEIVGVAPRFANPAGLDYHLLADSPAIDAGTPVPWLTTDIDGDVRPQGNGYDVGADEFGRWYVHLPLVVRSDQR